MKSYFCLSSIYDWNVNKNLENVKESVTEYNIFVFSPLIIVHGIFNAVKFRNLFIKFYVHFATIGVKCKRLKVLHDNT